MTAVGAHLSALAEQVGAEGPVRVVGGGTQVPGKAGRGERVAPSGGVPGEGGTNGERVAPSGGVPGEGGTNNAPGEGGTRSVRAPAGVLAFDPAEMTVRVAAGTPVAELQATLAEGGQHVRLPQWGAGSTVGGALATGRSDVRRLGWGPVRDVVLQLRWVDAWGRVVTAGGPTVKNVSGFDLCRLHVGAHGTLGVLGEAVLRTHPLPRATGWWAGPADPDDARSLVHRPTAVLWDGTTTWVLLEGHPDDLAAAGRRVATVGLMPADGPPSLPPHRWSVPPAHIRRRAGEGAFGERFVAEVGVGVVHASAPMPAPARPEGLLALNRRVKDRFDPTGRLNPGAMPAGAVP